MKVFLAGNTVAIRKSRQQRKIKAVQSLLAAHKNNLNRRFYCKLTEILLFPESFFLVLPAPLLVAMIEKVFQKLENKPDIFNVYELELEDDYGRFLVIHSRNASHIVDSLIALQAHHDVPFQVLAHPVLNIKRQGDMIISLDNGGNIGSDELLVVLRIEALSGPDKVLIDNRIQSILHWAVKVDREQSRFYKKLLQLKDEPTLSEYSELLDWMGQGAFLPFEYRELKEAVDAATVVSIFSEFCPCPEPEVKWDALKQELVEIYARSTSVIVQFLPITSPLGHQALVYLGVRGCGTGTIEHAFFGVFDETERNLAACKTPYLCKKIEQTLADNHVPLKSYEYIQLQEIFNLYPKVELFLLGEVQLRLLVQSLKRYLCKPNRLKLLFLASPSPTRLSVLIVLPADLFKEGIEDILKKHLQEELDCFPEHVQMIKSCGRYLGLHLILKPKQAEILIDVDSLDKKLNKTVRPWAETFRRILEKAHGKTRGGRIWQQYNSIFPSGYQDSMPARYAVKDIALIEKAVREDGQFCSLLNPCQDFLHYRLHFCSRQERYLDEYIPVLENLHLRVMDQVQFRLENNGESIYLKSFTISSISSPRISFSKLKSRLIDCIQTVLNGKTENDSLNSLLVLTGLTWQQIEVLRTYRNYYLQLGFQTSLSSFNHAMISHPDVTRNLFDYFDARFNPAAEWSDPLIREEQALFPLRLQLLENMATVQDINDDKILRTVFNLIDSTMRSNFHVRRELDEFFIAIKLNSLGIIDMSPPRPQYEIYVHAVNMEGIHLRGGKISRGGIRWSDRPDDFRTEILGLMQTQMSKNALIIPKGAKGGFVVKQIHSGLSFKESGEKAYVTLMQGLLDLTDNYQQDQIVQAPGIVSYDDRDPYLVVAADKGTAQFSDLANSIAAQYKFWLKDAFASGGSLGYNHKSLGITARGAWECVKRHFRETGKDIQSEPFTVVGIGSMDGDVFGNGMLLSRYTRLLAAISGRHIFLDPDPDNLEKLYQERQRLFNLPGSSWADYDSHLISEGGGVFSRDDKDIVISPQVRKWLGIRYSSLDGSTLIRYLLIAQVELLWLGGIGTYVKAGSEKHEEVGDRNNDEVRVDAQQLKALIVGEGANLGFTQKARVEYALAGGRINTDAIDNSAGVDTSDHEVNLKILLTGLQNKQVVADYQQMFVDLTEDVCKSVLDNNYSQSLCLSLEQIRSRYYVEPFLQLAERLEVGGILDRKVESFPSEKTVKSRPEHVLTRPELAVLMASAKMLLTQDILDHSSMLAVPEFDSYLLAYFPQEIRQKFSEYLGQHPLVHAIKATVISNKIINQAGVNFLTLDGEYENGNLIHKVICYLAFDQVLQMDEIRSLIYDLDNKIKAKRQYEWLLTIENTLLNICQWVLLQGQKIKPDAETLALYQNNLKLYRECLKTQNNEGILSDDNADIPLELAEAMHVVKHLSDFPMLVTLSTETGQDFILVYQVFSDVSAYFELKALWQRLGNVPKQDSWTRRVFNELQAELKQTHAQLIEHVLKSPEQNCNRYFAREEFKAGVNRYQKLLKEVMGNTPSGLMPFLLLSTALKSLSKVEESFSQATK